MNLFYAPDFPEHKSLPSDEAKHAIKVLRMAVGDVLHVTNGKGKIFRCEISSAINKRCEISILGEENVIPPATNHLHIAIAPVKNFKRFEWFLEKVTEIGVHEITPIICHRNERRVVKHDRAEKVLISAMKQSLKGHLPKLNQPISFSKWLDEVNVDQKFVAHLSAEAKPLAKTYDLTKSVVVAVGPEGDFSEDEIKLAMEKGFVPITLGAHRLRTETAGVAACAAIHTLNEKG